jgi:Ca2+/Na+ antiporter
MYRSVAIYLAIGFGLSLVVATIAWRRSRSGGGYYDREVYGMDRAAHRWYAGVSLAFAAFFAVAYLWRLGGAGILALALYAVIAVFYFSSFLRGAADLDE